MGTTGNIGKSRLETSEVLAEREYMLDSPSGTKKVIVQVGFPTRIPADNRYVCYAAIQIGDEYSLRPMNGTDAVESVQLAFEVFGIDLRSIVDELGGSLTWAGGLRHGIGFPSLSD